MLRQLFSLLFPHRASEQEFFALLAEATQRNNANWRIDGERIVTTLNHVTYTPAEFVAWHKTGRKPEDSVQTYRALGLKHALFLDVTEAAEISNPKARGARATRMRFIELLELRDKRTTPQ